MPGSIAAACARRSMSGSATATSSTSSRVRHAGRWPRSATLPNPRMAPRSRRLIESGPPAPGGSTNGPPPTPGGSTNTPPPTPGGSTNTPPPAPGGSTPVAPVGGHLREDLFQDGDAVARLGLGEDERRIEAYPGEVAHEQEATAKRAEEDTLRDLARERFLGAAVLHQVHPDEAADAAHVADELVAFLQAAELAQQDGPDPRRVRREPLVDDRLHGHQGRRRGQRVPAVARRGGARVRERPGRRDLVGGHEAAHGEAVPEPLADG